MDKPTNATRCCGAGYFEAVLSEWETALSRTAKNRLQMKGGFDKCGSNAVNQLR